MRNLRKPELSPLEKYIKKRSTKTVFPYSITNIDVEIKKYLFVLGLLLFSPSIYSQVSTFHVKGKVNPEYNDNLVTLSTFIGESIRSIDSTYVVDGQFSFEGTEYLYEASEISMRYAADSVFAIKFFLERGPIKVELKKKSRVISPYTTDYQQYLDSCRKLWDVCTTKGKTAAFYEKGWKDFFTYKFLYKKKYIHNGIGRSLFLDDAHYMNDPYFYTLYDLLPENDKLRYDVQDAYNSRKYQDMQKQLVGKLFIDFTLKNRNDKEVKISDYIGKSQLLYLDFWASWCGPCLAQETHIKELYERYKANGFDILGISFDTSKESWSKALDKKGVIWPELYVGNQERVKELYKLYCITGIPHGVIIDKTGKIVYNIVAQWQQLKWVLEEYYKK